MVLVEEGCMLLLLWLVGYLGKLVKVLDGVWDIYFSKSNMVM